MPEMRLLVVISSLFLFSCVSSQDITTLDNRLYTIEQQVLELQEQSRSLREDMEEIGSQAASDVAEQTADIQYLRQQTAGLFAELEKLGETVQSVNGKAEEIEYALREQSGEIEDQEQTRFGKIQRIEAAANLSLDRIGRIEHYLGFETSATMDEAMASESLDESNLTDGELYQIAKQTFDNGDYDSARQRFQKLLRQFPKSENADNAQFWIGETYYREKWYEKAILEYQKVIETYPKGNKVPAALLKQGLAFFNLRDKANARLIFKELTKKHPKSTESSIAKRKLSELK